MRAYERLLNYVTVYTTSDPNSGCHPSSQRQFDLAHQLVEELKGLGLTDAAVDEQCYVYAHLPASEGCEQLPALGLIAHVDTADDASGENVKPQIHPNYDGGDILLPGSGKMLRPDYFPDLKKCVGETLITTDGTTLLGGDDKAGIAEIMTAVERIIAEKMPHPQICVAFTPDEEIGEGADGFDVERFGAAFAYTVDGDDVGGVEYENFNAASAVVSFTGINTHPGTAKNAMVNAQNLAMEFHSMLPAWERPEHTECREGFFHLSSMQGTVGSAKLGYIIRDHSESGFEARKERMQEIADYMTRKYGEGFVELKLRDSYRNMMEVIRENWHLVENAEAAARAAGVTPFTVPVRGGTDGAHLCFMGLPCPNLGTGGFNFHGESEFITVERMDRVTDLLCELAKQYSVPGADAKKYQD